MKNRLKCSQVIVFCFSAQNPHTTLRCTVKKLVTGFINNGATFSGLAIEPF